MVRWLLLFGSMSALTAVAAGAFGAHWLAGRLEPGMLEAFHTGVRYQMSHALALLFVALAAGRWPGAGWKVVGWWFIAGSALFAGSLYALAFTGWRAFGVVTPLGGLCLLVGWTLAVRAALRSDPRIHSERVGITGEEE